MVEVCLIDPSVPALPPISIILHAGIHSLIPGNLLTQCLNWVNVETILPSVELGVGSQAQHAIDG